MMQVGFATVDITPPAGLAMSGYAARTEPATGAHDRLTARAIVVNDTAILAVDVIGIEREMSRRIRERCVLPQDRIVITAVHNHGGPISMRRRLGVADDASYLDLLEQRCVEALDTAAAARQPAILSAGTATDPGFALNRRHAGGVTDPVVPVLRAHAPDGRLLGTVVSYACHPVVLGADNRLWTADYPGFFRDMLESANAGSTAIFLTGCCGDANTGHSARASVTLASNPDRSFSKAEELAGRLADTVQAASLTCLGETADALNREVKLDLKRPEGENLDRLTREWQDDMRAESDPAQLSLLRAWVGWAATAGRRDAAPLAERLTLLDWGGMAIAAMPGEIFAQTALDVRAALASKVPAFVLAFADDNPGYIPPAGEFPFGGYEVEEAYRFYGQPAPFAQGSAERMATALAELAK